MNRPKIAVLALALAAASTGAVAAAGDRWYGASGDIVVSTPVEVTRVYSEPVILENDRVIYHERIAGPVIERPVIVVGLPRSGTTHLVNLIAADSRWRSLPYWESLEPVRAPGERDVGVASASQDRRLGDDDVTQFTANAGTVL
jgi:hypothetical protein